MKKTLLAATVALGLMAGQADAFTVGTGGFEIDLTGYTTSAQANNGAINTWAIFRATAVLDTNGDSVWNQSSNDYVFGAIWGLTDLSYSGSTPYSIEMGGGSFAMFKGSGNSTTAWSDLVGSSAQDGLDTAEVASLFSGYTQILTGDFRAGLQGSNQSTTVVVTGASSLTTPSTGHGQGYADVTGGSLYDVFNSNLELEKTDVKFLYDLSVMTNTADLGYGVWGAKLSDPVTGTAVPEPSTMMLLGLGMFGLAVYGKRRMDSNKA